MDFSFWNKTKDFDMTPVPLTPNFSLHPTGNLMDFQFSYPINRGPGHALDWIVTDAPNRWLDTSHHLHYIPTVGTEYPGIAYPLPNNYVPSPGSILLGLTAVLVWARNRSTR